MKVLKILLIDKHSLMRQIRQLALENIQISKKRIEVIAIEKPDTKMDYSQFDIIISDENYDLIKKQTKKYNIPLILLVYSVEDYKKARQEGQHSIIETGDLNNITGQLVPLISLCNK